MCFFQFVSVSANSTIYQTADNQQKYLYFPVYLQGIASNQRFLLKGKGSGMRYEV